MRTIKELAKEAIDVQDACNLSGVVHSFSRAITDLRECLRGTDPNTISTLSTDQLNEHPICILYADKIMILTDPTLSNSKFSDAYRWALDNQ